MRDPDCEVHQHLMADGKCTCTVTETKPRVSYTGICPLCGKHMEDHFVLIRKKLFPNVAEPIGWRCPDKEDPWPQP